MFVKIYKEVGMNWRVECDRNSFTVYIFFKDKLKDVYSFDKLFKAINFYARLKKVKDVKDSKELSLQYL